MGADCFIDYERQRFVDVGRKFDVVFDNQCLSWGLLGIQKGDREASARQGARNFVFFDAPVGIFITVDSYLAKGNWADTGMYIQTVMLAAKAFGLDTCPQAAWIPYQEAVYRHLSIPEDQSLVKA